MRVLVTGGTGFIGAHALGELIEAGHEAASLDIADPGPVAADLADDVAFLRGDVTDPVDVYDAVVEFEPDRVIHLAAMLGGACREAPRRAFEVNVGGTFTVLEAAETVGAERVVAASSINSYGNVPPEVERLDESVTQRPATVYGLTKFVIERIGPTYDPDFVALRPGHGIGPGRERGMVEDALIAKAAVAGVPITVPRVEDAIESIHVGDLARAFVAAALADDPGHDRYVVGTGERASLLDLVEAVREAVPGAKISVAGTDEWDTLAQPPVDASRIREDLGWEPRYTVAEAVEEYVEWLRATPDAWSLDPEDLPWETG